jgi:hypothetical protein
MTDDCLPQRANSGFKGLKKTNQYDKEYWSASELQPLLGYTHCRSFEKAVRNRSKPLPPMALCVSWGPV